MLHVFHKSQWIIINRKRYLHFTCFKSLFFSLCRLTLMFNSLWYQRRISNYKLTLANKQLLYIPSFLLENVVSMSNYHWVINERALSKVYTVLESIWERKSDCGEPFLNLYKELSITLMHISHINREASISLHVWLECSRARYQPFSQYRMARAASVSNRVIARKLEREQKNNKRKQTNKK